MEGDLLSRVIAAEREIQDGLDRERSEARDWVEQVRREAEEEILREREDMRLSLIESLSASRTEAEAQAAAMVLRAREKAERMGALADSLLKKIVMDQLYKILPD